MNCNKPSALEYCSFLFVTWSNISEIKDGRHLWSLMSILVSRGLMKCYNLKASDLEINLLQDISAKWIKCQSQYTMTYTRWKKYLNFLFPWTFKWLWHAFKADVIICWTFAVLYAHCSHLEGEPYCLDAEEPRKSNYRDGLAVSATP